MKNLIQKEPILLLLFAVVFSFVPFNGQALTYNEIQQGKVLGDSTANPYPSGSLVNDGGTIYFIDNLTKIPFTNWQAFIGLGYSLKNVIKGDLSNYSPSTNYFITTASASHPWGSWLLYNSTVYYSTQQGLIPTPSWQTFLNNGGQSKFIVKANKYDIANLNANPNLPNLAVNDSRITRQPADTGSLTLQPISIPSTSSSTQNLTPPAPPLATVNTSPANTSATSTQATTTSPATNTVNSNYLQKPALVFQIDQGFGNGIIQNQDSIGLKRIIASLQAFQSKYEVYVTLSARQTDKTKLDWALGILAQNNLPFILEVYASDALSLGADSVNNPYDVQHGREMSVIQLQQYKTKYGNMFAGVRTLEIFAQNFTVLACQQQSVNWCDSFKSNLPTDRFYQKSYLEDYIKFAHDNGMFLLFTDFYWSAYHPWSFDQTIVNQPKNEQDLQNLVKAYPNTVVVAFANNEPAQGSINKMATWQTVVRPYVQYGAKGFGLSDQSWICSDETNCPASTLANWATTAFGAGALVVQTEPYWYWWNFPKGAIGAQSINYTTDTQWANRGYANANLQTLATQLGVTLPSGSVNSTPTLTNNATCVSVNAPDWVKPGTAFTGTVSIKNTGTTTWTQNSATNPNPYRLAAADFKLPPYTSSIWGTTKYELPVASVAPGGTTTFTISTTAPTATSTYAFGWQMLQDYKEWFGDTCSKTITVSNNPPPPTNPQAVCAAPGNSATVSWAAPSGYNNFFLRVKLLPNPTDGSAIAWNDNYTGTSYTFSATPGLSYNWWVHTKNPTTGNPSDAAGSTFVCPAP